MCALPSRRFVLGDPGELIAAIPALLGFHPHQSLVITVYTGPSTDDEVASVVRIDFPHPQHRNTWLDQIRTVITNQHASSIVLVVFADQATAASTTLATAVQAAQRPLTLPHVDLIEALSSTMNEVGTRVLDALWVPSDAAQTWHAYGNSLRQGTIPDATTLPVVSELILAGEVTYASREGMAAVLAPDAQEHLARRSEIIAALPPVQSDEEIRFLIDFVRRATNPTHEPDPTLAQLDDGTIARLAHALAEIDVFMGALALCVGPWAATARGVWLTLLRGTPKNLRANPAALYAVCAYLDGDGGFASIAVEVAEQSDADHPVARLIHRLASAGTRPAELRSALTALVSEWADQHDLGHVRPR